MTDHQHVLPVAAGHLAAPSRQYRSTSSESPARPRHATDELLAQLSPLTALQALKQPTGSLRRSMDSATASEQSFAIRAAIASQSIQGWLTELSRWPWPDGGGSAGFEPPPAPKRRRLFASSSDSSDDNNPSSSADSGSSGGSEVSWMGSLPAADVAWYDQRIEQIQREMDDLDVEEIKTHVLHHHILPLSRPGTPLGGVELARYATSFASFNKMDDLTAIITAVVLQALPNLSRLIRLMNTWSARIVVLKRVPALLASLSDVEAAIRAAWQAITPHEPERQAGGGGSTPEMPPTTQNELDSIRALLELDRKISRAARVIDFMLDSLDGRQDTIPDVWIDRMETVEREYAEWVAVCERRIHEAEWRRMMAAAVRPPTPPIPPGGQETPEPADVVSRDEHVTKEQMPGAPPAAKERAVGGELASNGADALAELANSAAISKKEPVLSSVGDRARSPAVEESTGRAAAERPGSQRVVPIGLFGLPPVPEPQSRSASISEDSTSEEASQKGVEEALKYDGVGDSAIQNGSDAVSRDLHAISHAPDVSRETAYYDEPPHQLSESLAGKQPQLGDDASDSARHLTPRSSLSSLRSQPSLPSLHEEDAENSEDESSRRWMAGPGPAGGLDIPSDLPDVSDSPRVRDADAAPRKSASSLDSPPNFRASTRSTVTFSDMPTVTELPRDEASPPKTPLQSSFLDDPDVSFDMGSPSRMSVTSEDDQLQQQISEILESIPAKIHLSSQPSPINHLNPPDLQLPRAKPRPAESGRSFSSMSSRSGTPSFLLAPAYNSNNRNPRPRQQRGNQEIKLYHLSRSTGEAPIRLFIRLVGEHGERVMVRVGGGWADLGEYLKEYASHHGRRSKSGQESKIEVRDLPAFTAASKAGVGSSPPSRPGSALDSPMTPLHVRKTRRSMAGGSIGGGAGVGLTYGAGGSGGEDAAPASSASSKKPQTPLAAAAKIADTPSSGASTRSRSSSRLSWTEEDSSLGMSGPRTKHVEMSEESRAWVESVKEKVRIASGERKPSAASSMASLAAAAAAAAAGDHSLALADGKFGEMGKVGGTKRLFRKG